MYMIGKQKNEKATSPGSIAPETGAQEQIGAENATGSAPERNGNGCSADGGTVREALAMVYSPRQYWRDAYSPAEALDRGTLFAELDKPLTGICVEGGGDCR